jgi:hypothetical protein
MSRPSGSPLFVWLLLSLAVTATMVYAYIFLLPQYIGFEKTLLFGVALLVLSVQTTE